MRRIVGHLRSKCDLAMARLAGNRALTMAIPISDLIGQREIENARDIVRRRDGPFAMTMMMMMPCERWASDEVAARFVDQASELWRARIETESIGAPLDSVVGSFFLRRAEARAAAKTVADPFFSPCPDHGISLPIVYACRIELPQALSDDDPLVDEHGRFGCWINMQHGTCKMTFQTATLHSQRWSYDVLTNTIMDDFEDYADDATDDGGQAPSAAATALGTSMVEALALGIVKSARLRMPGVKFSRFGLSRAIAFALDENLHK